MSISDVAKKLSAILATQGVLTELIYRLDGSLKVTLYRGTRHLSCRVGAPSPAAIIPVFQALATQFPAQEVACAGS